MAADKLMPYAGRRTFMQRWFLRSWQQCPPDVLGQFLILLNATVRKHQPDGSQSADDHDNNAENKKPDAPWLILSAKNKANENAGHDEKCNRHCR